MDKCLCGLLISSDQYNYCPSCGQVIRSFDVTCPQRAYLNVPFTISIRSGGSHALQIDRLSLDESTLVESVSLNPGASYEQDLVIAEEGISILKVQSGSLEETYQINVVERGSITLRWQNNQLIYELDKASHRVYVSRSLADKTIYPDESSNWFRAKSIRLKGDGSSFELDRLSNGFKISDELFDYLQDKGSANLDIELISEENHRIELSELSFYYDSELPDLKLIPADDYVNSSPLGGVRDQIGFTLEYRWDQKELERPINAITIELSGSGIVPTRSNEYFNNQQRLEKKLQVDLEKVPSGLGRINVKLTYEIQERIFCRVQWIDFQVKVIDDIQVDTNGVVAIDFGTSNTCVAYIEQVSKAKELFQYKSGSGNAWGLNPTIIKFIEFRTDEASIVEYADRKGEDRPLTFAANFKPRLERDEELYFWDLQAPPEIRPFRPSQLCGMYLNAVLNGFALEMGNFPGKIIMSYPASFSSEAKARLFKAINLPGVIIHTEGSLSEPENIALYYSQMNESIRKKLEKDGELTICVFDCGGGTTDVSIVKISESHAAHFEILATWGTDSFSGNVIDYLVGTALDGDKDWYPKNIRDLYTTSNESLKEYLARSLYYEDLKKAGQIFDSDTHHNETRKLVESGIQAMYDRVRGLMKSLFDLRKMDTFETDFLILAGNSCFLEIFNDLAKQTFGQAEIIWEPEDGKRAVALGALEAYELRAVLDIRGTTLSSNEYSVRLNLHGYEEVFPPLLDMSQVTEYLSPPVNPSQIPILGRAFIRDHDQRPTILFEVPCPKTRIGTGKMRFRLRFKAKEVSYGWCSIEGEEIMDADYKTIYRED